MSNYSSEFAAKVANDINEGIDCGESRAQLRKVIQHWANECSRLAIENAASKLQSSEDEINRVVNDTTVNESQANTLAD